MIMLSVIIICHNQKDVVKRCIESVLQQKTSFTTEVIVSDDRSTDGTREMLLEEYNDKVISTFCDSNECNASFTLERSGYNRLNGLKLAKGKYLIHTDGDDFFTSTDLFQTMVDTLESHPECSLCCQNYCMVNADNINVPHEPYNKSPLLAGNRIVTSQEFYNNVDFLVNACFCARRDCFNTKNLWGGTYDDNFITARYISNGKIAILNRCDFVYVQYEHSTCATMEEAEKNIIFKAAIGITELAPAVAGSLLNRKTVAFYAVAKHVILGRPISKRIQAYCSKYESFIFHSLSSEISIVNRIRYFLIFTISALMLFLNFKPKFARSLLYRLAIGRIKEDVII